MSAFDKYVAQFVSRAGNDLPREAREKLLANIHESLVDYDHLRDPAAAKARREVAERSKRTTEEKIAREEAERKRQERQANLPPLPPGMRKSDSISTVEGSAPAATTTATVGTTTEPKKLKKAAKKKTDSSSTLRRAPSGAKGSTSTGATTGPAAAGASHNTTSTTAKPASAPASKPAVVHKGDRTARRSVRRLRSSGGATASSSATSSVPVPVRDIDFAFGKQVDEQLHRLESEPVLPTPLSSSIRRDRATAAPGGAAAAPLSPVVVAPAPAPASPPTAARAPTTAPSPKRTSPPPPLSQVAAERQAEDEATREGSDDASQLELEATRNYQEALATFQFAPDGDAPRRDEESRSDDAEEEEEYIDDREDARRRTMQMQRPSRPAISDSTLDIDEARIANFATTPKSQNKIKTISRVLVRHFLFSTLDDSDIAKVASIMDIENFQAGAEILSKGDPNDVFYVLLEGEAEVAEVSEADAESIEPLVRGSTCGDLALMYEVKNDATVVARTPVQCAALERRTYKMLISRAMEEKRRKYNAFLASIPIFADLTPYQLERIAENLKEDVYVEGQKVITAGVPNHWLHFVVDGALRVVAADPSTDAETEVATKRRGDFVGEIEFIYHHLPVATVYVVSPVVKTAKLSRRSYEQLPSEVREKLIRLVEEDPAYLPYQTRMRSARPPAVDMTPPFDAPPANVQRSMRMFGHGNSNGSSAASGTPPPAASP